MLKVGDVVKIREDLVDGENFPSCYFTGRMKQYRGMSATIIQEYDYGCYGLDVDNNRWYWDVGMFDLNYTKYHRLEEFLRCIK